MRITFKLLAVSMVLMSAGIVQAAGLTKPVSISEYFLGNSLTMQNYLSNELKLRQSDSGDLRGDIYEFHSKSPFRAFIYSLAIPGAGQFYTGSKIKAGTFFAIDAILWGGYLLYHSKGVNMEKDYKSYADKWYHPSDYWHWYEDIADSTTRATYSHQIYRDPQNPGSPIRSHEYYENIGKYDQFQVGWEGIGLNHPPPPVGEPFMSEFRSTYLGMRQKSNDYFSNATTMAMVSIGNHLVSAFEAAIGARKYNRGSRQYSMQLESRDIDGHVAPFIILAKKF